MTDCGLRAISTSGEEGRLVRAASSKASATAELECDERREEVEAGDDGALALSKASAAAAATVAAGEARELGGELRLPLSWRMESGARAARRARAARAAGGKRAADATIMGE